MHNHSSILFLTKWIFELIFRFFCNHCWNYELVLQNKIRFSFYDLNEISKTKRYKLHTVHSELQTSFFFLQATFSFNIQTVPYTSNKFHSFSLKRQGACAASKFHFRPQGTVRLRPKANICKLRSTQRRSILIHFLKNFFTMLNVVMFSSTNFIFI